MIPSPPVEPSRTLSLRKRTLFGSVLVSFVYLACELIALGGLHLTDEAFSMSFLRKQQTQLADGTTVSEGASEAVHPYLGWTHNPEFAAQDSSSTPESSINWLGFRDDSVGIYQRSADTFLLGIAGGSVAWGFSWDAQELLREKLSSHPMLQGRKVQIVRLAMPGYKQPQQLMAYNYLLSLGAEFDAMVNIDGYNEAVLTFSENAKMGTAVSYPRSWHSRIMAVTDPRLSAEAARLLYLRGKRQAMAKSIRASWFHWSWLYNLVWQIRDNYARAELADLGISVANQQRQSFTTHGPKNRKSEAALHQEVADLWQRCSMQMHHLCRANGTLYLHVLQPNQYVPNSKPLNDAERAVCISNHDDSITYVPLMYPLLQERGATLQASGVEFSDQTMVFSSVEQTLYIDLWCHFSSEGQRILGAAVAGRLLQMLDAASAADSRL